MSRPLSVRLAGPLFIVLAGLSPLSAEPEPAPSSKPTPYTLAGIDLFGNDKTADSVILGILGIKEGAEVSPQVVTKLDEKVRTSGRFTYSKVSSTDYGDRKSYLTVDVLEKGDEARFRLNPPPTGDVAIPAEMMDLFERYEKASFQLFQVLPKRTSDIQDGHFLDSDAGLRKYQERFLELVPKHYDALVRGLREDKDPQKRVTCATLLGWAKDKKAVITPLQEAFRDPEPNVRAAAARSLTPIAYYAVHKNMPVPLEPILALLRYPTSTDRTKAVALLLHLAGDPSTHATIRTKAGDLLVRMAGIHHPTQREHALTLLTLVTGEKYGRDPDKWKAWWKSMQDGTWKPPKPTKPPPSPEDGNRA